MSIIALTTYNDMAGSPTPSSGILLGLDLDGTLKQKDQNGNITVVGSGGGTSGTSGTSGVSGTSGSSGTSGTNGYDGANTFRWIYGDESTATEFRLNDINFPIDNVIYINTTSESGDASSWLNTLVDHVTTNPEYAYLHLVEVGTPNNYAIYKVLSGSSSGVYYNFSLSYINGDGIAATGSEYTIGWSLFGKGNLNYAIRDITYADLATAIDEGALQAGQHYRITDYVTAYNIFDGGANAVIEAQLGTAEPLIVLATGTATLAKQAYSALYPHDIIHYNPLVNAVDRAAFIAAGDVGFVTAGSLVAGFKGLIEFRHDTKQNVSTWYDFRNIKFRRWAVDAVAYNGATAYVANDVCKSGVDGKIYKCITATTGEGDPTVNTADWILWLDIVSDAYVSWTSDKTMFNISNITTNNLIFVPATYQDVYTFGSWYNHVKDVTIGHNNLTLLIDTGYNTTLNNIVFKTTDDLYTCYSNEIGEISYNNTIKNGFFYNSIGNGFFFNTIENGFSYNTIENGFSYNSIGKEFSYNSIGNGFNFNSIGNEFSDNSIGKGFFFNIIGNQFQSNTIGGGFITNVIRKRFSSNVIGNEFSYNSIGNDSNSNIIGNNFSDNTIGDDFSSNTIGDDFSENTIGNGSSYNTIGYGSSTNTIGNNFLTNTIGNNFSDNTIGNYFSSNTIVDGFQSNTIGNNSLTNTIGNNFSDNTIGDDFSTNTIGNVVSSNIIGNGFSSNTIGNRSTVSAGINCQGNSIGDFNAQVTLGDNCTGISIGEKNGTITLGATNTNISIGNGNTAVTIGDNCIGCTIGNSNEPIVFGASNSNIFVGNGNVITTGASCLSIDIGESNTITLGTGCVNLTFLNGCVFNTNTAPNGLQNNIFESGTNITATDFTSATFIKAAYNTTVFMNATPEAKLSYFDALNALTVNSVNA